MLRVAKRLVVKALFTAILIRRLHYGWHHAKYLGSSANKMQRLTLPHVSCLLPTQAKQPICVALKQQHCLCTVSFEDY
eukprot:638745-Amphidinium_carterae.1